MTGEIEKFPEGQVVVRVNGQIAGCALTIIFGRRIPIYFKYAEELTPKEYINRVRKKEIDDPVLNFQISNDFHPSRVLKGHLEGDTASNEFAVLLKWDNIYYGKPGKKPFTIKKVIRIGLIQCQMRPYRDLEEGMQGGEDFRVIETDCGKIGVLICYDAEFPEMCRLLADEGMDILFIPFLTDTQNGYSRVRHCAQARAIENECYVAIAGSVGNLPNVHNMDIQFAQSMVFTPCDFAFPINGIKAEATPNTEMILIADVDIDLLRELHQFGSVRNLLDRRKDIYRLTRSRNDPRDNP